MAKPVSKPSGFDTSKAKLKADKATGEIEIDGITKLSGIPRLHGNINWETEVPLNGCLINTKKETIRPDHCRKIQHLQIR